MSISPGVRPNEENEESRTVTVALFYLLFGSGFALKGLSKLNKV